MHPVLTRFLIACLIACLPAGLAGLAAQTVHTGTAPGAARLPSGWTSSLAAQPDGALWCLVAESDGSGTPAGSLLHLFRSRDDGATWTAVGEAPTLGDGRGAIVAGRGCDELHVTWHATDGGAAANLYYQLFDTRTLSWVGTADLLLAGTNANDQYYPNDMAVTDLGTVAIAFNCHRSPTLSGFSGWSGGLFVRRTGDPAFQGPFRLNTDSYGMLAALHTIGEVVHSSFRTNTGLYGIQYRAFDSATLQFLTGAEVPLYGRNQGNMRSTNSSDITADREGNLYVLYTVGPPNPAGGAIEVAFAAAATGWSTWITTLVESDAGLSAGNLTYQHFALARGDSGGVYAVFAKENERQQNLHMRILSPDPVTGGALVLPDPAVSPALPLLTTTEPGSFQRVDGLGASAAHGAPMIASSGAPASQPAGAVAFLRLGSAARTVEWGRSCRGNLAALPRTRGASLPQPGTTFTVELGGAPPGGAGLLFAGFDCLRPPFELGSLGFTGCTVFFAPAGPTTFFLAGPAGDASFPFPLPAGLPGGFAAQFGVFLLAPGANPGGAVVSNALSAIVD